jgi:outer membrane immunogenic protein
MRTSRFALILAAGAAMQFAPLSQPASAADLPGSLKDTPYVVAPSWAGLYFGGHAGGVWGNTGVNDKFDYVGDPGFNGTLGSTGFIGGAQAGYNFQRGHFVFGPEADIGYLSISASKSKNNNDISSCTAYYGPNNTDPVTYDNTWGSGRQKLCWVNGNYSSSSDLYGDLTARFGYATDRTLFYVKGGAALLDADFKASYQGQNCVTQKTSDCKSATHVGTSDFNYDHSDTLVGWTIGAGAEYALSPSWSLKAEYQHFDFGKMSYSYNGCVAMGVKDQSTGQNFACPTAAQAYSNHYTSTITNGKTDVSITADAVKFGINYHLNNEAELK